MNQPQRAILLVAVLLFAVMGLFPPYLKTATSKTAPGFPEAATSGEYAPVWAPPTGWGDAGWSYGYRVDTGRLLVQWAVLGALTVGLLLALRPLVSAAPATPSEAPALRPDSAAPPSSAEAQRSRSECPEASSAPPGSIRPAPR